VGFYGVEGYYNQWLTGMEGKRAIEQNPIGEEIPLPVHAQMAATAGTNLILTVDRNVQMIAVQELERAVEEYQAQSGTVVIMNPKTGAILALACDFRFIAAGRKLLSLNEVKIGLPVPYLADLMLRQVAGDRTALRLEYLSEFLSPEDAQTAGLVDAVCPEGDVEAQALSQLQKIADLPPFGFPLTKQHRVNAIRNQFLAAREEINQGFMDLWWAPPVQALLSEAAKKF